MMRLLRPRYPNALSLLLIYFASVFTAVDVWASESLVAEGKAKVFIYRDKFTPPLAFKPMITINDVKAFYLPRGYHADLELDPGMYVVLADWGAMHGVADREINIELAAGETYYININTGMYWTPIGIGTVSSMGEVEEVDLSESVKITRWHYDWVSKSVGGFQTEPTLNERFELTINTDKLLQSFAEGSEQNKQDIARYLLHHQIFDETILMVFEQEVLDRYQDDFANKAAVSPLVFVLRYLAESRMEEFKPTVYKVRDETNNKHLLRYSKKFIKNYYEQ